MLKRLIHEARRRRVFRTAAIYIVGSWLVLQVADVLFPGFGIPDAAIQALVWAAVLGFPVAMVFGWLFDIGRHGIRRTPRADAAEAEMSLSLERADFLLLAAIVLIAGAILYNATRQVLETPRALTETAKAEAHEVRPLLENSIAVLPFTNISSDPENEFFCDGVSEEILHRLGSFRELTVIGRTSSFAFKGSDYPIPRIAGILGVRFLLQGSVRKFGDQLRVSAQLLDLNGVQIWSQNFDRQLKNVFEIQSEIADSVATTVAPQIVPTPALEPHDLEAYQLYLAGRDLLHKRSTNEAIRYLERAIELEPGLAEAHAELGVAFQIGDRNQSRAELEIATALSLKPNLLRAQAALGLSLQFSPPRYEESIATLHRVLEQDPNNSDALLWLANAHAGLGQDDKAFEILKRAVRIDPLHPSITGNLGHRYLEMGMKSEADEILQRALQHPSVGYGTYIFVRDYLTQQGRFVEMNRLAKRQALELKGPHFYAMGQSYSLLGDFETATYWYLRSQQAFPEMTYSWLFGVNPPADSGRYVDAVAEYKRAMHLTGRTPDTMRLDEKLHFGALLSLAGDYEGAISVLQPLIASKTDRERLVPWDSLWQFEANNMLAWALLQTGKSSQARAILARSEGQCREVIDEGLIYLTGQMYICAQKSLLLGEVTEALDRLETAIDEGWRLYYWVFRDPTWASVSDNPRYQALMKGVKDDVDAQRAEVEKMDAEHDFVARLDEAMSEGPPGSE